jgi:hypothetical protein
MKALTYLIITQLKNRILSLKKKPAFLILYGFIFIMIAFSIVMVLIFGSDMQRTSFADERILFFILAALSLFFLYAFTTSGLQTGSSLFTMPDVGLLFVAPISSKKILMYGLLSTLGKSLLGSIFIFYQIGNLKTNFGYGVREIIALFMLFALMMLFCQLLSIGIYIYSNGNPKRKRIVKMILYAVLVGVLTMTLLVQKQDQVGLFEAALRVISSGWFGYIPIAGWTTMFFMGVVQGSIVSILIPLILYFAFGIMIISLLTVGSADYYEDVLLSTEFTYQTKAAAKEGRNMPRQNNKKIKIKDNDSGIGKGTGAWTLLYKHMLEMRRKSRFIYIDTYSVFMMVAVGIAGYNFKRIKPPEEVYYSIIGVAIYFQYFLTMMGRLKQELMKHYIYLIPETSMKKVFAASLTSLIKPCFDGALMFAVLAVISGVNPLLCLFFALAYAASGAVFSGLTILYQRVLGGQPNMMIQMFVGMGLLLMVMAPSIGASVAAAVLLPDPLEFLCMLPYTIFCLLFALLLFVLNGNLIDKAEYTGKP